jgi:hypothetical protein
MAKMIRNVLFIVEGKTEGYAQAYGKGLQNILRVECEYMRQEGIRHHTLRKNGKSDLLCNVGFDVRQHLEPSKKTLEKLLRQGSKPGDFVFILRDLDCEDEPNTRKEILAAIELKFHNRVEICFAVQEVEAWMIADAQGFCSIYRHANEKFIDGVRKLAKGGSPEETIDCNPKPSDLLSSTVRSHGYSYRKSIEGPQALGAVEIEKVSNLCPHFKILRDSLRKRIGLL